MPPDIGINRALMLTDLLLRQLEELTEEQIQELDAAAKRLSIETAGTAETRITREHGHTLLLLWLRK